MVSKLAGRAGCGKKRLDIITDSPRHPNYQGKSAVLTFGIHLLDILLRELPYGAIIGSWCLGRVLAREESFTSSSILY